MSLRVRLGWLSVIGGVVVGAVVLRAQQGTPPMDASMRELVGEVRALRLAVERSTEVTSRSQTLLGRVQLQENRLADLGRRLDDARQRVRSATAMETTLANDVARTTMTMPEMSANADDRRALEMALNQAKGRLKAAQGDVAQLRAEEQELIGALSSEQARWSDYNTRLEAIERDVAARKP